MAAGRADTQIKTPRFVLLAAMCIVIAALYFARDVLVPLALAVMFSFLLRPLVTRLERLGMRRALAVSVIVTVIFSCLGLLTWLVVVQVEQLADQLPGYQDNIVSKVRAIRGTGGGKLEKAAQVLTRAAEAASEEPATRPATQTAAVGSQDVPLGASEVNPLRVKPVTESPSRIELLSNYIGTALAPIGTFGIVIVFVIFMLLQLEDLRDRIIRLVGEGRIHVTTQALDEAAKRISRYLVAQAIVNGTYGLAISIGLCVIGFTLGHGWFPSFALWGLLCALLRFIPYIGPWIGAAFPITLAFAVYPGYAVFAAVLGLFVVIELISNNVMEPMLYGSSTGISTLAILVAAVFWTWLWGPVGLLLATPLTVCIVVIGKYVPQLAFLDILLGDQPVLEPHQRLYQRLLADDSEEAWELVMEFLKKEPLETVYNNVILPALAMAEQDRHSGRIDERSGMSIRRALREMVEELADLDRVNQMRRDAEKTLREARDQNAPAEGEAAPAEPRPAPIPKDSVINVVCLPAHDEADEIVGLMLAELLRMRGFSAFAASQNALASEMLEELETRQAHIVCVSALPPDAVAHARYLCKRIFSRFPKLKLVVGLWTLTTDVQKVRSRIACIEESPVATDLVKAIQEITELAQPMMLRQSSGKQEKELEKVGK